jgi:polyhydroxyalkanoate synthase
VAKASSPAPARPRSRRNAQEFPRCAVWRHSPGDIEAIADNGAARDEPQFAAAIEALTDKREANSPRVSPTPLRLRAPVAEYGSSKPTRRVAQADLYSGLSEIWRQTLRRYGGENVAPIVPSDLSDKRFSGPEWNENPFFDWLRQSYLLASRWAGDMVESAEGLDPQTKARAVFYTRLISSAISPSNFVPTNPELLRATMDARRNLSAAGCSRKTFPRAAAC